MDDDSRIKPIKETRKEIFKEKTQNFFLAAVAQTVKQPELRSLKLGATELTRVQFPVVA